MYESLKGRKGEGSCLQFSHIKILSLIWKNQMKGKLNSLPVNLRRLISHHIEKKSIQTPIFYFRNCKKIIKERVDSFGGGDCNLSAVLAISSVFLHYRPVTGMTCQTSPHRMNLSFILLSRIWVTDKKMPFCAP